jgi:bifunctional DNA-binding transcriptional regulator/antitoxin component of YhaV-PrlF toxin-antitoxin module
VTGKVFPVRRDTEQDLPFVSGKEIAPGHENRPSKVEQDCGHKAIKGRSLWTGLRPSKRGFAWRPQNGRLRDGAFPQKHALHDSYRQSLPYDTYASYVTYNEVSLVQEMIDIRIAENGRMVLPRSARKALGVTGAGVVVLSIDGDNVKLTSMRQSIKRAQDLYRQHATNDLPVDDFIAERRAEAAREDLE